MQTVKVRIAVAVDGRGQWNACGCNNWKDSDAIESAAEPLDTGEARYFVTAELPIPQPVEVAGEVEQ